MKHPPVDHVLGETMTFPHRNWFVTLLSKYLIQWLIPYTACTYGILWLFSIKMD